MRLFLLVLVWLMKRFLYKPILEAIDRREKRIGEELPLDALWQRDLASDRWPTNNRPELVGDVTDALHA